MLRRRDFIALAAALAAGEFEKTAPGHAQEHPRPSAPACRENIANPPWKHVSSAGGDLPVPDTSDQQTGSMVGDIDGDGRVDFVFTNRVKGNAAIWMQNNEDGWRQHVIDPGPLNIEAGGTLFDVDGDGRLDVIAGGDSTSSEVWWWQNPYPDFSRPWTRRVIKQSGKNQHHDMLVADLLGEGRPQLVFWNQGAHALFLARIPEQPRAMNTPWDLHVIYQADAPMEGMAMADVDGDGVVEVVGGGRWFKHERDLKFKAYVIDDRQKFSRAAAGKLIKGSDGAQVVFDSGDGCGELNWYERRADGEWVAHNLLGKDVVHGHTLRVADIDGDGNLDIFCAEMAKWCSWTRTVDYPRAHLWVFYGDGRGSFEKSIISEGGDGTHEAQLADFDGDGKLDILGKPYMAGAPGVDLWLNPGRG